MKRRLFSMLTALALCLFLLPTVALAAEQVEVDYREASWDSSAQKVTYATKTQLCTKLTSSNKFSGTGWYVVEGNVTCYDRLIINGNAQVNLILTDDCQLNAYAISVQAGCSLTIYDQDEGTGTITVGAVEGYAGIGAPLTESAGSITIHGGIVNATGGNGAAGIGGAGFWNGAASRVDTITIYGGQITAKTNGYDSAAIGGGTYANAGTINIYGGVINANGKGTGIGSVQSNAEGSITIHGGTVTANGIGTYYGSETVSTSIQGGVVFSDAINQNDQANWNGVIFENNVGKVYGSSVTIANNVTIPAGKTLTIETGTTLIIPAGVTFTNNGKITNNGTITNSGTITNNGTFADGGTISGTGTITGTISLVMTTLPTAMTGRTYNGTAQKLITDGIAKNGTMQYSLDGTNWSSDIPEGTNAGTYNVQYKAVAQNSNHVDTEPVSIAVTIDKATLTPSVASVTGKEYDGKTDAIGTLSLSGAVNSETPDATGTFTWTNNAAGTTKVNVTDIALTDAGMNKNYQLNATSLNDVTAPSSAKISPKSIAAVWAGEGGSTTDFSWVYDGNSHAPTATAITGVDSESVTLAVSDAATNYSASAYTAIASINPANGNYTLTNTTHDFTITQASLTVTGAVATGRAYNGTNVVSITSVTLSGIIGNDEVSVDTTGLTGTVDSANVGSYTTVTLTTPLSLTGAKTSNYTLFQPTGAVDTSVTITKADSTVETAPAKIENLSYTGEAQNLVTAGTSSHGTFTYSLEQNGTYVSTVPTGTAAGSYTVYWKLTGDGNHNDTNGTATGSPAITPATLTWDASGLSALKRADGNTDATVTGTLLVSGALGNDDPGFTYIGLSGTYESAEAGSHTVTVTVTGGAVSNKNYDLPTGSFTITGTIKAVTELTSPADGFKLEQEEGISEVPDALNDKEHLNTPARIEAQMILSITDANNNIPASNIMIYDLILKYRTNEGASWTEADASHLPAGGITVVLPYPEGTGQSSHDFIITHMFTTGDKAGTTETIIPTKTADGLRFTLMSLSPIAVGYKTATTSGGGGGSDSANYTLTFDVNGGSAISAVSKVSGTTVDLTPYKPTKTGVTFDGWYSDSKLTDKVTSVKLTKSVTVYAKWTKSVLAGLPFTDVAASAYYYDAVQWAVENSVTSGTTATTFAPNATCTRAQTVTFLWRAMGSPEPTATGNPFIDVSPDAYYYKAVLWAVEKGITAGTSATTFAPDATVSRAQTVTFLWRAEGKPTMNNRMAFNDVDVNQYYAEAIRWAVSEGITGGTGATVFSPTNDCTRAQIVTFLFRYLGK